MLAAVSSAASLMLPLDPYKGQTVLTRSFHGMATLAVGLCFYLCATLLPSGPDRLRSSLRAIYAGGILTLLWSSIQATYVLRHIRQIPLGLNEIHRLFSVRDLFANRADWLWPFLGINWWCCICRCGWRASPLDTLSFAGGGGWQSLNWGWPSGELRSCCWQSPGSALPACW
jgi:hypothetical protein